MEQHTETLTLEIGSDTPTGLKKLAQGCPAQSLPQSGTTLGNDPLSNSLSLSKGEGKGEGSSAYTISKAQIDHAISKLSSESHKEVFLWLHTFCATHGISVAVLAKSLRKTDGSSYDHNTLYKILTGKHDAKPDNFVKAVLEYKRGAEERVTITKAGFVETKLFLKIKQFAEKCGDYHQPGFIFGALQTGKTESLLELERRYPNIYKYVRVPEGGKKADLCFALARKFSVAVSGPYLPQRIIERIVDQYSGSVFLFDECHQGFMGGAKNRYRLLEYIRNLWDVTQCGMVLCATRLLRHEILEGETGGILQQLWERKLAEIILPDKPTEGNLADFARGFGLPPAEGAALILQTKIITETSLTAWLTRLRAASSIAAKHKSLVNWNHVLEAHKQLSRLSAQ